MEKAGSSSTPTGIGANAASGSSASGSTGTGVAGSIIAGGRQYRLATAGGDSKVRVSHLTSFARCFSRLPSPLLPTGNGSDPTRPRPLSGAKCTDP